MSNLSAWFTSSTGQGVSLTLKGIVLGFVPVIIFFAQKYGIELSQMEIAEIIETATTAISACMIVYGLIRKLVIKLGLRSQ